MAQTKHTYFRLCTVSDTHTREPEIHISDAQEKKT